MGYFDGLVEASFKKDAEGRTVFYRWGVLGKGVIVPTLEAEAALKKHMRLYMKIVLLLAMVAGVLGRWVLRYPVVVLPAVVGVTLLLMVWGSLRVKSLTNGFDVSTEKLRMEEAYTNSAQRHNKNTLWVLLILSILFTVCSFGIIGVHGSVSKLLGIFGVVLFGGCSFAIGFMIKQKK